MLRARPAIASILFFLFAPGIEAGVGPWVLTGFHSGDGALAVPALRIAGGLLIGGGLILLLASFRGFVREGDGTPSPLAPPGTLVAGGPYRFLRNPMYVATVAIIAGEGLLLARPVLLAGAALYLAAMASLVRFHEEPLLRRRFGPAYDAYRVAVPGWWPRRPVL